MDASALNAGLAPSAANACALRAKTATALGLLASAENAFGLADIAAKACGLVDSWAKAWLLSLPWTDKADAAAAALKACAASAALARALALRAIAANDAWFCAIAFAAIAALCSDELFAVSAWNAFAFALSWAKADAFEPSAAIAFASFASAAKACGFTRIAGFVPPKGLGGQGGGTNPEQLFASGYAACFGSAVAHIARLQKIHTGPVGVTAKVSIGPVGKAFGLAVELSVSLPEVSREQGEALVKAAHEVCPYSNATRGNIDVKVSLAE